MVISMSKVISLFLLLLLQSSIVVSGERVDSASWMSKIDDNVFISSLSIPGTHDSGAFKKGDTSFNPATYLTQASYSTIRKQLEMGVRFLDIRCNQNNDACTIHHGRVYLFQNLNDILDDVYGFIDSAPGGREAIIMSIKHPESSDDGINTLKFHEVLQRYIDKNPSKWYTENKIPKIGEVRGKIVLLRRFASPIPFGINAYNKWPDNTDGFWLNDAGVGLAVQDYYNVSIFKSYDDKKRMVKSFFQDANASTDNPGYLFLNFTSAISGSPNPKRTSENINPVVSDFFSKNKTGEFGCVVMDFITPAIARSIFETNF